MRWLLATGVCGGFVCGGLLWGTLVFAQDGSDVGGRPDPSFGESGALVSVLGSGDSTADAVRVDAEGNIVVAGFRFSPDSDVSAAVLLRYLPDGRRDPSFGEDGSVVADFGGRDAYFYDLVFDAEGRIVVVGEILGEPRPTLDNYDVLVQRYLPDGTLDETFGDGGTVQTDSGSREVAYDLLLDDEERIVVAGAQEVTEEVQVPLLVRYLPDGQLDTSFGEGGVATQAPEFRSEWSFYALGQDAEGRLVAVGEHQRSDDDGTLLVARYLPDGRLDTTFGDEGAFEYGVDGGDGFAFANTVVPLGNALVVAGEVVGNVVVLRLDETGGRDASFGEDGVVIFNTDDSDTIGFEMTVDDQERLLVVGWRSVEQGFGTSEGDVLLLRFLTDGRLDPSFGDGGVVTELFETRDAYLYSVALDAEGRIVVAGETSVPFLDSYHIMVARYLP